MLSHQLMLVAIPRFRLQRRAPAGTYVALTSRFLIDENTALRPRFMGVTLKALAPKSDQHVACPHVILHAS